MIEEYVKDNYYARFDIRSCHCYWETHFNDRLDFESWQSYWNAKSRSKAPDDNAYLKIMLLAISMQGLTLTGIVASEKQI